MILQIKNLSIYIDDRIVLDSINLDVKKGSTTLLLGKNGAGKSTILKSVIGFRFSKFFGDIFFENEKISDLKINEIANRGVFLQFQNPPEIEGVGFLKFLKTAYDENFEFEKKRFEILVKNKKILTNRLDEEKTRFKKFLNITEFKKFCIEEIKRFDLPIDFFGRSLNEGFSGGEKKVSELIQMIILRPKFVMMDEPDSGLDVDMRKKFLSVLRKMKKEFDTTFLIVSHYMDFSLQLLPDKVFVIENGKNFLEGEKDLIKKISSVGFENL